MHFKQKGIPFFIPSSIRKPFSQFYRKKFSQNLDLSNPLVFLLANKK
jgi:hypothetical protein